MAPYTVHILWQTIQYVLLTGAEVLVSLTCIIFAYSQAPKRYKVVIMSAWLLTSALGDLLVVVIAKVHLIPNQVREQPMRPPAKVFSLADAGIPLLHVPDGRCSRRLPHDRHALPRGTRGWPRIRGATVDRRVKDSVHG